MPKTISVQIISPTSGDDEEAAAAVLGGEHDGRLHRCLEEEGDQARHEAVEEARLGEREAEPLDRR